MPLPLLGACVGARAADAASGAAAETVTGGGRVLAAVHALFPHTIGVLAGFFGATAVAVSAAELNNSKPEEAANVGGAGLGWMDEERLKEKAEREDAEINADKAKARAPAAPRRAMRTRHAPRRGRTRARRTAPRARRRARAVQLALAPLRPLENVACVSITHAPCALSLPPTGRGQAGARQGAAGPH
jgi:hypothetical protein